MFIIFHSLIPRSATLASTRVAGSFATHFKWRNFRKKSTNLGSFNATSPCPQSASERHERAPAAWALKSLSDNHFPSPVQKSLTVTAYCPPRSGPGCRATDVSSVRDVTRFPHAVQLTNRQAQFGALDSGSEISSGWQTGWRARTTRQSTLSGIRRGPRETGLPIYWRSGPPTRIMSLLEYIGCIGLKTYRNV